MRVSVGASDAQSMAFTLQRSRAILHDYTQDFRRSKVCAYSLTLLRHALTPLFSLLRVRFRLRLIGHYCSATLTGGTRLFFLSFNARTFVGMHHLANMWILCSDDGTLRPRTEMMCREKQSLHSSVRMADDLIK